jgi:hypothetical protein
LGVGQSTDLFRISNIPELQNMLNGRWMSRSGHLSLEVLILRKMIAEKDVQRRANEFGVEDFDGNV